MAENTEHHHHRGLGGIQDGPQCCCTCTMLTLTPRISPWEERKRDLHRILNPEVRLLEHAHFRVIESSTLHAQPSPTSLKSSNVTLSENAESKSLPGSSSSSSVPYHAFSHQKAPSSHARDYRKNYTYPNMERQIMSSRLRRGVSNYSHSSLSSPLSVKPKLIVLGENMEETKQHSIVSKPPVKALPIQSARPRLGEARFLLPRRIIKPPSRYVPSLLMYPNNLWKNVKPVPLHVPIHGSSIELKRQNASVIPQISMARTTGCYCPTTTLHIDPRLLPYSPLNPGKVPRGSSNHIGRIDSATLIPPRRNKQQH